jgi:hypothetical protein
MIKQVIRIGDLEGLVLDPGLLRRANLKVGDEVDVTLNAEGIVMLTPTRKLIGPAAAEKAANEIIARNSELFRRLS